MPANMGMILLAGIVVNNSILLIDFIEKARAQGSEINAAIEQAVRVRTRPILMTASATIVGMLPIAAQRALGLERLSPLAVVAIGGLFLATFLTLIYVPIFYVFMDGLRERVRRQFAKRGVHTTHGALYRTLRSTNTIENLNGSIGVYTRNVKRWHGGSMRLRWGSAAAQDVSRGFRKVRGYRSR